MRTLVVIHTWSGDRERVESMLEMWTHHDLPVLVLSPVDAPLIINHPQVTNMQAGLNSYNESMDRYVAQFRALVNYDADYYLLCESDAMCLRQELPEYLYEPDVLWGNHVDPFNHILYFGDPNPARTYATHDCCIQSPWFFSRHGLQRMVDVADEAVAQLPPYAPFIDWWFHMAPHAAGLEHRDYGDDGISHAWANEIRAAVQNGAFMIHAVKERATLEEIRA